MKIIITTSEIIQKLGLPMDAELVIEQDQKIVQGDWISNIGHDRSGYPDGLSADTKVEVKLRSGYLLSGCAGNWSSLWKETDGDAFATFAIVAYRVL